MIDICSIFLVSSNETILTKHWQFFQSSYSTASFFFGHKNKYNATLSENYILFKKEAIIFTNKHIYQKSLDRETYVINDSF